MFSVRLSRDSYDHPGLRNDDNNHSHRLLLMFLKKLGRETDGIFLKNKKIKGGRGERREEERDSVSFQIFPILFFPDLSSLELFLHPFNFARALIICNAHLAVLYFTLHCYNRLLLTQ